MFLQRCRESTIQYELSFVNCNIVTTKLQHSVKPAQCYPGETWHEGNRDGKATVQQPEHNHTVSQSTNAAK